jgi:hypothetical protein
MCCLGIRPIGARQTTMRHLMGTMCVPSAHKEQLKDPQKLKPLILAFISIKFGPVFVISMSTLNTPSTNPISVQHWYAAVTSCLSLSGKRQLKEQLKDSHKLNSLNTMIQKGIVQYNQIEASLDDCGSEDEEEPFCNIAVTECKRICFTSAHALIKCCYAICCVRVSRYD